jgi:hypothetical protein
VRIHLDFHRSRALFIKLENQLSIQRQRVSQTDKEKQNLQGLLHEEINNRDNLNFKLKQSEVRNSFSNFFYLIFFRKISKQ